MLLLLLLLDEFEILKSVKEFLSLPAALRRPDEEAVVILLEPFSLREKSTGSGMK